MASEETAGNYETKLELLQALHSWSSWVACLELVLEMSFKQVDHSQGHQPDTQMHTNVNKALIYYNANVQKLKWNVSFCVLIVDI